MKEHRYSKEEVDAILGRALREHEGEGLTHDELVAVAKEVGVSADAVARAAGAVAEERELEKQTAELRRRQVRAFYTHFTTYLIVCGALTLMNLFLIPGPLWFPWVLLGWGIGVLSHLRQVVTPDMERLRERAREREERKRRREDRKRRKEELERSAHELGAAVTKGLAVVAQVAADKLEEHAHPKPHVRAAVSDSAGARSVRVESDRTSARVAEEAEEADIEEELRQRKERLRGR